MCRQEKEGVWRLTRSLSVCVCALLQIRLTNWTPHRKLWRVQPVKCWVSLSNCCVCRTRCCCCKLWLFQPTLAGVLWPAVGLTWNRFQEGNTSLGLVLTQSHSNRTSERTTALDFFFLYISKLHFKMDLQNTRHNCNCSII